MTTFFIINDSMQTMHSLWKILEIQNAESVRALLNVLVNGCLSSLAS